MLEYKKQRNANGIIRICVTHGWVFIVIVRYSFTLYFNPSSDWPWSTAATLKLLGEVSANENQTNYSTNILSKSPFTRIRNKTFNNTDEKESNKDKLAVFIFRKTGRKQNINTTRCIIPAIVSVPDDIITDNRCFLTVLQLQ